MIDDAFTAYISILPANFVVSFIALIIFFFIGKLIYEYLS